MFVFFFFVCCSISLLTLPFSSSLGPSSLSVFCSSFVRFFFFFFFFLFLSLCPLILSVLLSMYFVLFSFFVFVFSLLNFFINASLFFLFRSFASFSSSLRYVRFFSFICFLVTQFRLLTLFSLGPSALLVVKLFFLFVAPFLFILFLMLPFFFL